MSPQGRPLLTGAMLYEMVTGRPPFVGDDSIAIIGQHINTPPVSPPGTGPTCLQPSRPSLCSSWKRTPKSGRSPPPWSSGPWSPSVRKGRQKSRQPRTPPPPTDNPLYRRVFVGREAELKQLQSAFDGAMSGQGALMMVLGEPGIGKTAVTEQLATYVNPESGRTLVGHCYEEGSLSLPYLAFVEAMRSYVLDR